MASKPRSATTPFSLRRTAVADQYEVHRNRKPIGHLRSRNTTGSGRWKTWQYKVVGDPKWYDVPLVEGLVIKTGRNEATRVLAEQYDARAALPSVA